MNRRLEDEKGEGGRRKWEVRGRGRGGRNKREEEEEGDGK